MLVIAPEAPEAAARLDAEIRVGGDAGASDVVILRPRGAAQQAMDTLVTPLVLPDTPIVAWWPHGGPDDLAADPLGRIAQRRISDVGETADPIGRLYGLRPSYSPGDTDLSWARTTLWRGLSAGVVEADPGMPITAVVVEGDSNRPSVHLLAAWFAQALDCTAQVVHEPGVNVITGVELERQDGTAVRMHRPEGSAVVTITTGGDMPRRVAMAKRPLEDSLMEDLRHLNPDEVYATVLLHGLDRVNVR